MKRLILQGTTDTGGDLTVTGPRHITGKLHSVMLAKGTWDSGGSATVSVVNSLAANTSLFALSAIGAAAAMYYPRVLGDDASGADLTGWYVPQTIDGVPKLVIASGGSGGAGAAILYYEED